MSATPQCLECGATGELLERFRGETFCREGLRKIICALRRDARKEGSE